MVPHAQSTSPSFSPSAPQVEPFEPEIEIPARDNVKRPPLHAKFTDTGVADMQDNKPGPYTRSSALAKSGIIPESVTLSDSDDDLRFSASRVCLVSYGASKSPAASTYFQQASAVPAPSNKNVSTPTSRKKPGPLRPSAALPPFGTQVRFKLSIKENHITVAPAYDTKHINDDMPALEQSSSDEGDM